MNKDNATLTVKETPYNILKRKCIENSTNKEMTLREAYDDILFTINEIELKNEVTEPA